MGAAARPHHEAPLQVSFGVRATITPHSSHSDRGRKISMSRLTLRISHSAATLVVAVIAACAGERRNAASKDSVPSVSATPPARGPVVVASQAPDSGSASEPVIVVSEAADTQHVHGTGVPTAPDDTLGTQYGKHWGPARMLPAPRCRPHGFAICLIDTARTVRSGVVEGGGFPDQRVTEWLVFAADHDSLQVFIVPDSASYLWMLPASAEGFRAEHAINDASWIRARFPHAGTYVYSAHTTSDTAIRYELRIAPVVATGATWPTGGAATLTVDGADSAAIVPAAMAHDIDAEPTWRWFAVPPGTYRVLLVRDSVYVTCALPCRTPRRIVLRPSQAIVVRP